MARYPIDFDILQKGQLLTAEFLENACGHQRGTTKYEFFCMTLAQMIFAETGFTAKRSGDDLRILTDSEAAQYNARRVEQHVRGVFQRFEMLASVDMAALAADERREYERQLLNKGRYVQALVTVKRRHQLEGHARTVPGLPGAQESNTQNKEGQQ
jgi:hypothetical protein